MLLLSCNYQKSDCDFWGIWINTDEKCQLELSEDFTFNSSNLPLDVNNKKNIKNKDNKKWEGNWKIENHSIKLELNKKEFYYLEIDRSLFPFERKKIYITLHDDVGGNRIYLRK